jgi:hypothetical protein
MGGYRSFSHVYDVVSVISDLIDNKALLWELNNSNTHFEAFNIENTETSTAR